MVKMKNEDVITRILSGNADSTDIKDFKEWLNESEENKAEFQRLKNIWDTAYPVFSPEHIDSDKAEKMFFEKINRRQKKNRTILFTSFMYKAAAILFIPLLISTVYLYTQINKDSIKDMPQTAYQTISIPFGMTSSVELADGSTVWLNAGTTMKYPVQFDKNFREVELIQGEAFFEVNANPKYPFIVKTNYINVTATGTRFNVNAYPNEENISVSLDKGKVNISKGNSDKEVELTPGEILSYNKTDNSFYVEHGNVYNHYAWIDGLTIFRNANLKEVFCKLEQKYNVHFIVKDKEINNYPYHATFENESLSEIIDIIEEGNSIECKDISKQYKKVKGKKVYIVSKQK